MSYRVNLIGPRSSYGIPGSVTPVTPTALPTATKTLVGSDYPFSGYTTEGDTPTVVGSALQFGPTTRVYKNSNEVARPFTMVVSAELSQGDSLSLSNANIVLSYDFTTADGFILGNQDVFDPPPFYSDIVPGGRQILALAYDGTNIIAMPRGYTTQICPATPPNTAITNFQASTGTPKLCKVKFYNSWIGIAAANRVMEDMFINP